MLAIGVDASPLRIAYAITLDETILEHALIHTRGGLAERENAWMMIRDAATWIETERDIVVERVGIEDAWHGPNRRGVIDLSLSIGQTMAWAYTAFPDAELVLVSPQTWRSACGLPRSGKTAAAEYAARVTGKPMTSQDEADAVCIALATVRRRVGDD